MEMEIELEKTERMKITPEMVRNSLKIFALDICYLDIKSLNLPRERELWENENWENNSLSQRKLSRKFYRREISTTENFYIFVNELSELKESYLQENWVSWSLSFCCLFKKHIQSYSCVVVKIFLLFSAAFSRFMYFLSLLTVFEKILW